MAFAVKMIVVAVAALAFASQVSCKPFTPLYSAPAAALTTYHAPALATYHAPAYPIASVAHVPAVTTHVASYPSYGFYGAKYAAAVPAVSAFHYPAASAFHYPASYSYGYPSGLASTTFSHPYSPYSTTVLHK